MEVPVVGMDGALGPIGLEPAKPQRLGICVEKRLHRADHRWTPLRAGIRDSIG